jgi:hypothetical protein
MLPLKLQSTGYGDTFAGGFAGWSIIQHENAIIYNQGSLLCRNLEPER